MFRPILKKLRHRAKGTEVKARGENTLPNFQGYSTLKKNMKRGFLLHIAKSTLGESCYPSLPEVLSREKFIVHQDPNERVYFWDAIWVPNLPP